MTELAIDVSRTEVPHRLRQRAAGQTDTRFPLPVSVLLNEFINPVGHTRSSPHEYATPYMCGELPISQNFSSVKTLFVLDFVLERLHNGKVGYTLDSARHKQ